MTSVTSHKVQLDEHRCHYLACGPEDGPLMFFLHGWPELSRSWRHQLPAFGALGFRAIAPDMRGYGQSSTYNAVKALFRKGDPAGFGQPSLTAMTRINDGWFGPDSYYMNHAANADYAAQAVNEGRLDMPVLFIGAQYDYTCETISSELASPMREYCTQLTEQVLPTGHWMAQEKPAEVNRTIQQWLADTGLL